MAKKMKGLKLKEHMVNYIDEHGTESVEDISLELEFECGFTTTSADRTAESLCRPNSSKLKEWQEAVETAQVLDGSWQNHPATYRQKVYLTNLGVAYDSKTLTKGRASQLIDAAKGGHLGSVGGFYNDGSN